MDVNKWDGNGVLPWLYAKTANGAINVWCAWVEGDEVVVRWGQLDGAMQDARFKCLPKNEGKKNETTGHAQAIKEAVAKWKKQLKKKYFESAEEAMGTRNFKPMLAHKFQDKAAKLQYPAWLQPKFDGVRCLAFVRNGMIQLMSRGGDPYSVQHIQQSLHGQIPEGVVLDGELYQHGAPLQNILSLVRTPQEASLGVHFHVYDYVLEDTELDWAERMLGLNNFFAQRSLPNIVPVPVHQVGNEVDVWHYHDWYVENGYEGAIVRLNKGTYKFGSRSSSLLKVKKFDDAEFPIVGVNTGKGKFEGMPIFVCRTGDGLDFEVVPVGTEEHRRQLFADAPNLIGKPLTVRFLGWTEDRKPRCATGRNIREPGT